MALPEHEVAAAELRGPPPVDGAPQLCRLHVGIARRGITRRFDGELHQARAVEADAGAAAPQIGRAEKGLGDGDEIAFSLADRRGMAGEDIASARKSEELAVRRLRR